MAERSQKLLKSSFEMQVLVHGRSVREYPFGSELFVEGRIGNSYTLRFFNRSSQRVEVVVSIDGLSVMNGEAASREIPGYVVQPSESIDIAGWRLNNDSSAKFEFSNPEQGYASLTGRPENIGVIGCLVFYEKQAFTPSFRPYRIGQVRPFVDPKGSVVVGVGRGAVNRSLAFGGIRYKAVDPGAATGFGEEQEDRVTEVSFNRQEPAAAELVIRYDTRENLERRGIIVTTPHQQQDQVIAANPFPADKGCTPPPGWRPRSSFRNLA